MKKSFSFRRLFLAGIAGLTLAGCSNQNGNFQADDPVPAEAETVRIKLAIQSSVESKTIETGIEQFNASHPGMQVEVVSLPRDRYDQTLNMLMTSGEGPDLFQIGTGWLANYIYKNWLLDLSEVVDQSTLKAFPEWAVEYTMNNGHFYAVPSQMLTLRLLYNKELLASAGYSPDRPPVSMSEMMKMAGNISQVGTGYRKYGFALPAGEDGAGFQQALEMANTSSGIYYYDFSKGNYDFTRYEPWFQAMLAAKRDGGLFPGEVSLKGDTALTQFAKGNIGMMFATNRDFVLLNRLSPMQLQIGIAMPPILDSSNRGKGALMISPEPPFVINAYTKHKQETAELWKFLHSREYLGEMYKQGEAIPTLGGITDDDQYHPLLSQFDAFLPNVGESPYPKEPKFILQNLQTIFSPRDLGDAVRMKAYRDILQGVAQPGERLQSLTEDYNNSLEDAVHKQLINLQEYLNPKFDPLHPLDERR
jgi:multiple sugar transport system substrate-binding protein